MEFKSQREEEMWENLVGAPENMRAFILSGYIEGLSRRMDNIEERLERISGEDIENGFKELDK